MSIVAISRRPSAADSAETLKKIQAIRDELAKAAEVDADAYARELFSVGSPLLTLTAEEAINADVALIEAWQADRWGNLRYRTSGRNFNPVMATAADLTICQTQHIVELGELSPDDIHTPGIFVSRIILNAAPEKRIEQRTVRAAALTEA